MNLSESVFTKVFDRLKNLGFEVPQKAQIAPDIYSLRLVRDGMTFDMKCIAMGNKGIIHVMREGDLKSLNFDIDQMFKDDQLDPSKMSGLLVKIETGLFHQRLDIPTSTTSMESQVGIGNPRSQFGIGEKDLDPLAAAPGMNPPRFGSGGIGGGGMIMDPSHPLFTQPPAFHPHDSGPMVFPPGSIPPGVRFDPITPLGPRFAMGARPPGRPGFPVRPGPWTGEPDQDEFLPPGHPDDMYM